MEYTSGLIEYLKSVSSFVSIRNESKYNCFEDFVLRNGYQFKSQKFDSLKYKNTPREMRQCYRNAWYLANDYGLTYVEGYASSVIPVLHAWCIDKNNKVVDPTWRDCEHLEYYGVPFTIEYLLKITNQRGMFGLIDNMEQQFPLITGKDTEFKKHLSWKTVLH